MSSSPAHADGTMEDHPFMAGTIGMGLTYQTSTASETGQGSFFGRFDIEALSPLWIDVRWRVAPVTQVDTLLGYRFYHHVGLEGETHEQTVAETATTRTVAVTSEAIESRSDAVLVAGFTSTSVIMPAKSNGMAGSKETDPFKILTFGVQWHTNTIYGSHRVVELYGMYNMGTSSKGITALWHNSIHNPLSSRLVFGMEAGWIPASTGSILFWSIVDIGYAFEL